MPISPASSVSATATGLSGLRAAQQRMDTHAHNIANVATSGFQRQTVVQTEQPGTGGVNTAVRREPASGSESGSQLAEDLVGQRMSLYSFAANLKTVRTQDDMLGALLDTKA
ncbi:flagellar basal body protein [Hydrogenophaga sp.]|uniref:flagellar basal body protein n=1 Tax=Hydrogenophaga sp. TaxID=1904254 RepID=UPI0025C51A8C|nr:flagellar basal body protein [Hydrogenophaga sp.]